MYSEAHVVCLYVFSLTMSICGALFLTPDDKVYLLRGGFWIVINIIMYWE